MKTWFLLMSIMALLTLFFMNENLIKTPETQAFMKMLLTLKTNNHDRPRAMQDVPFGPLKFTKITLMGQFNYGDLDPSTWCREWSRVFPEDNIVVAIPKGAKIKPNATACKVMKYAYPKVTIPGRVKKAKAKERIPGLLTPCTNLAKVIRHVSHESKGVLYVHDDLLVTKDLLQKILDNEEQWIQTYHKHGKVEIYLDGPAKDVNSNYSQRRKRWGWWNDCESKIRKLLQYPEMGPYLKKMIKKVHIL